MMTKKDHPLSPEVFKNRRGTDPVLDLMLDRLQPQKPDTSSVSEMLTPSEQESLRQDAKDLNAYGQKAFQHLRAKVA
jgi:hypothetical protein